MEQKVRAWFESLQPRERIMVLGAAALVLIVAIYVLALAPFYRTVNAQATRVAAKQADLAWMSSVAGELQALSASAPAAAGPSNETLVVLIDRTAREMGLGSSVTGQTPNGPAGIRVRLENAPSDTLLRWLGSLQLTHAVTIDSATIDRATQPGLVNVSLELNRASG